MDQRLSSAPVSVRVSIQELREKRLSSKNLEIATRALLRDGLVVLENVVDHAKLDILNEKMVEDSLVLQAAGDTSPYNYNKGNIQQDPPAITKYFDQQIFLNPLATQVTSTILGPQPRLSFLSGNSALPPTPGSPPMAQPIHSDADFEHLNIPLALVVNIPLVEMNSENGSTEVWLGTHHFTSACQNGKHGERASGRIKEDLLAKRREERPPSQPLVPKGSIVIRDLRLWHGGKPNFTDRTRVMLAMIYFAPWYRNAMQVEFADDLRPLLEREGGGLQIQGIYLPEKEILAHYLGRGYGNSYNFDQQDRLDEEI